jgi:hypothetical protein
MRWNPADNARNWISNILRGCNHQTTGQQQNRCEDIVQSKDGVISLNLLKFEVFLETAQQLIHFSPRFSSLFNKKLSLDA